MRGYATPALHATAFHVGHVRPLRNAWRCFVALVRWVLRIQP